MCRILDRKIPNSHRLIMLAYENGNETFLIALGDGRHLLQEGRFGVLVEPERYGTIAEIVQSGGDLCCVYEGCVL